MQHNLSFSGYDMVTASGIQRGTAAGNGFRALYFRGIPLVADEKAPSGNIFALNEKHLSFYRLPQPTGFTVESERDGFGWTGWLQGINADAVTARLQWYGQFICDAPRTQARRTGVTS